MVSVSFLIFQGRRNDSDTGEACLTSTEGACVKGESTRGGWGGGGGGGGEPPPRKF